MSRKTKGKNPKHVGTRTKSAAAGKASAPSTPDGGAPERRFPRIPALTSVLVRKLGGSIKGELSTTMVVGKGGCSFVQAEPEAVGSELYLSILVVRENVDARVRVVYSRPLEEGAFEIGVEFVEVARRDEPLLNAIFE